MQRSLRDVNARAQIVERIGRLDPDSERQWGKMEPSKLFAHMGDQLRMALGEIETDPPSGPTRFAPMRYLIVHVLPWPKGRAEAPPQAFTTTPESWGKDRAALLELIKRYVNTPPDQLAETNPFLGRMTARDWDVMSYRHLDHHLTQFGV
jgi:hypothetical protein